MLFLYETKKRDNFRHGSDKYISNPPIFLQSVISSRLCACSTSNNASRRDSFILPESLSTDFINALEKLIFIYIKPLTKFLLFRFTRRNKPFRLLFYLLPVSFIIVHIFCIFSQKSFCILFQIRTVCSRFNRQIPGIHPPVCLLFSFLTSKLLP